MGSRSQGAAKGIPQSSSSHVSRLVQVVTGRETVRAIRLKTLNATRVSLFSFSFFIF